MIFGGLGDGPAGASANARPPDQASPAPVRSCGWALPPAGDKDGWPGWYMFMMLRPYPAAAPATKMPATADAVTSGRHHRRGADDAASGAGDAAPGPATVPGSATVPRPATVAGAASSGWHSAAWIAVTSASRAAAAGRPAGSLTRHRSISGRTSGG